jgi:hypothetical protein
MSANLRLPKSKMTKTEMFCIGLCVGVIVGCKIISKCLVVEQD